MWPSSVSREAEERERLRLIRLRSARFALPSLRFAPAAAGAALVSRADDGAVVVRFHAGQAKAHASRKRRRVVLAGKQGGKTSSGPSPAVARTSGAARAASSA
jgi:hypothetical protein